MARGKSKRGCLKSLIRCRRGRELENDDDSIDENVHDARARRVRTNFYGVFLFSLSLSLSYKRTIRSLIWLFCFYEVPTRRPLRFDPKGNNL